MGSTGVYSMRNNVRCFDNLAKLHLMVSKSLLTQELFGGDCGLFNAQCIFRGEGSGEREEFLPLLAEWKLERYALKFNSLDTGGSPAARN